MLHSGAELGRQISRQIWHGHKGFLLHTVNVSHQQQLEAPLQWWLNPSLYKQAFQELGAAVSLLLTLGVCVYQPRSGNGNQ